MASYLPCSFVVLVGLKVAKRKYLRYYAEVFTASIFDEESFLSPTPNEYSLVYLSLLPTDSIKTSVKYTRN